MLFLSPPNQNLLGPGGGVIFDMDGLMLDTEAIVKLSWQQVARLSGYEMSDSLFASMIGHSKKNCAELMRSTFGSSFDFEEISAKCATHYQAYLAEHGVPLKPGVFELISYLSTRRIPLAVATSTRNAQARQLLDQAGLSASFSVLVAGDEIVQGKPAPDIYLEAVRRLQVNPACSLALEDSYAGIRAAHAAGLKVVMVPDLLPPTEEIAALTVWIAASLLEVKAALENTG